LCGEGVTAEVQPGVDEEGGEEGEVVEGLEGLAVWPCGRVVYYLGAG
jgi:hypothetical protein